MVLALRLVVPSRTCCHHACLRLDVCRGMPTLHDGRYEMLWSHGQQQRATLGVTDLTSAVFVRGLNAAEDEQDAASEFPMLTGLGGYPPTNRRSCEPTGQRRR